MPQDEDEFRRRDGLDRTTRLQATVGPMIIGGSYIRTQPPAIWPWAKGHTEFLGLDARWMRGGVQARGEWIDGRSFLGTRTFGGYVDVLAHRQGMGPVTAVARAERLDYLAGPFSAFEKRYTAGARIRLASMIVGHVNVVRQFERGEAANHRSISDSPSRRVDRPGEQCRTSPRAVAPALRGTAAAGGDADRRDGRRWSGTRDHSSDHRECPATGGDEHQAAKDAFDRLVQRRITFASSQSRLIAELPVFRAHLTNPRSRPIAPL